MRRRIADDEGFNSGQPHGGWYILSCANQRPTDPQTPPRIKAAVATQGKVIPSRERGK
jgi:hypothetical protein